MFDLVPSGLLDWFECLGIMASGYVLVFYVARVLLVSPVFATIMFVWHTLICLAYLNLFSDQLVDMHFYYDSSFDRVTSFALSTGGIIYITRFFSVIFGFSFLATNLFFSLFGAIATMFLYSCLTNDQQDKNQWTRFKAMAIVFLPSVSFWSSSIGKDGMSFLSVCIYAWVFMDFAKRKYMLILAILFMVLVRPHVGVLMLLSILLYILSSSRLNILAKSTLLIVGVFASYFLMSGVLEMVSGDGGRFSDISNIIDRQQTLNADGGSSIDISQMSLPMQMFTYLFRPMLFEGISLLQILVGFENLFLLFLAVEFLMKLVRLRISRRDLNVPQLTYGVFVWILLAMTTANLGIAVRQKWMIAPPLLVMITCVAVRRRVKNSHAISFEGRVRNQGLIKPYGQRAPLAEPSFRNYRP